ncbi:hypothetical protein TNCV_3623771, partial [Trichonephila clavipes]
MTYKDILKFAQSLKYIVDVGSDEEYEMTFHVIRICSSIVREFLELFYNLWRTVLAKNKIVLDSALRLQSFRIPENATIGVRSGIPQTKACQLAASLRADAADILQTLPETQRLDFDALVNALGYASRREMCEGLR